MKKITLSLIVASLMLLGVGMITTANADMPVYGVPGNGAGTWTTIPNSVAVRSTPHYYYGYSPDTFNFANIFGYNPGTVTIEVNMTDTVLQWEIGENPMVYLGTATVSLMAGGRIGSSTDRIILSVWTDGSSGGNVSFSGCADVAKQVNPGQGETLPTSYAFLAPTADPTPGLGEFITAANMNTTILPFNRYETTSWSVWSSIKVNRYTKRGTYRDDFSITVTGIN